MGGTVQRRCARSWRYGAPVGHGVLAFLVKTVWFYTLTRRTPGRLRLSGQALWAALRGDFTGHERFLR